MCRKHAQRIKSNGTLKKKKRGPIQKDLIGKKFGRLTVKQIYDRKLVGGAKRTRWLCTCSCKSSKDVIVFGMRLQSGKTKSCGCLVNTKKNLIEKQFGRLTVIKSVEKSNKHGKALWECLCACGNKCIVVSRCLLAGYTKSCGCLSASNSLLTDKKEVLHLGKDNLVAKSWHTSGIYLIINVTNGKFYVGSSVRLDTRFVEHKKRLNKNNHANRHLQNSWNKYGPAAFCFLPFKYVAKKDLVAEEQKLLDKFMSKYNLYNLATIANRGPSKIYK